MSQEQISSLVAKLKEDAGLREKLQNAGDLDAFVAMAKEAGFVVSKADWLKYQAQQNVELSDEELEGVVGGNVNIVGTNTKPYTQGDEYRCKMERGEVLKPL